MIDVIGKLGLLTTLKLCLDAGDALSYTSGQPWLDRSGNGYDFNRGATSGSEASDPTFNGAAGGQSGAEYYSFDGGDFLTYDSANEAWMDALHQDSAAFSFAFWIYVKAAGSKAALFGTARIGVGTGIVTYYDNSSPPRLSMIVYNAGATVYTLAPAIDLTVNAWNFVSVSINEAANTSAVNINGTAATGTATYSSPSAGSALQTMTLAANNSGNSNALPSGSRLASVAFWQAALSAANLQAIFNTTRGMFGL